MRSYGASRLLEVVMGNACETPRGATVPGNEPEHGGGHEKSPVPEDGSDAEVARSAHHTVSEV
ncbi:hypothetical protein SAV14893_008100 [Streptomyces avermitilis]|uniref:Uncharacterized protein n=1 Tax=Streptomyces avermitilis TaxID=33903 RepID=A0A4D4N1Z0_STRAX|nr:hypothetical protein SAVMC3_20170 [Streptomyces avermitilis]GDY61417.1 hypothetical protein SAV14893_008100 [Streptomyces avermitilis]GDY78490.1 hypothetical protein SAV31267_079750 [Streptomyces avermitilis]GDY87328.1 hypothetical protein SAVCW2_65270 [Streptomyces avermitilis]